MPFHARCNRQDDTSYYFTSLFTVPFIVKLCIFFYLIAVTLENTDSTHIVRLQGSKHLVICVLYRRSLPRYSSLMTASMRPCCLQMNIKHELHLWELYLTSAVPFPIHIYYLVTNSFSNWQLDFDKSFGNKYRSKNLKL